MANIWRCTPAELELRFAQVYTMLGWLSRPDDFAYPQPRTTAERRRTPRIRYELREYYTRGMGAGNGWISYVIGDSVKLKDYLLHVDEWSGPDVAALWELKANQLCTYLNWLDRR